MAIEKNYVKASAAGAGSRIDSEFSVGSRSRESMSSDDDELRRRNSGPDSEDDDEFDDADSGAGSDDFDLLELGETRSEFCQVGDQTCSIPFELYDLPDLHGILSLDVWNECLTEEERFGLTKYLPDMDQETFMRTLKELFEGNNFHFGSPITALFQMLKGGLCEPRVSLYRQGVGFFQKHQHYHLMRKYQDTMVSSLVQMKDAWQNCKGYSIEEKLRVLNIVRSQKSLMGERNDKLGSDSSEGEESAEALWSKRPKGRSAWQKAGHDRIYGVNPALDVLSHGRAGAVDPPKYGKKNPKGLLKVVGSRSPSLNEPTPHVHSRYPSLKTDDFGPDMVPSRGGKANIHDVMAGRQMREQMASGDDERQMMYGMSSQRDWNVAQCNLNDRGRPARSGKKHDVFRVDEYDGNGYSSFPFSAKNDFSGQGRNLNINQLSDIKVLTAKPGSLRAMYDSAKKAKYVEPTYEDQMRLAKGRAKQMAMKGNMTDFTAFEEPHWNMNIQGDKYFVDPSFDYDGADISGRKMRISDSRLKTLQTAQHQTDDRIYYPKKRTKLMQESSKGISVPNGRSSMIPVKSGRMFNGGEETESDSSDQREEEDDNSPLIMTKLAIHGRLENSRSSLPRSGFDRKKDRRAMRDLNETALALDGMLPVSSTMGDFDRHMQMPEETYTSRKRQKAKMQHPDSLQNFMSRVAEEGYYSGLGNLNSESDRKSVHRHGRNGQLQAELSGGFPVSMNKASLMDRRRKGNAVHEFAPRQSKYLQGYPVQEDGGLYKVDPVGPSAHNMDMTLVGFASSIKRQRGNEGSIDMDGQERSDYMQSHQQLFESAPLGKKVKKRPETDIGSPDGGPFDVPVAEVGVADLEQELKPQKKTFTLITPTIHTDFSFSIIHLLSAVRLALITPNTEDSLEARKPNENTGVKAEDGSVHEHTNGSLPNLDVNNPVHPEQTNIPPLTVQDIVNRVRSNPGDPCILETQEPLQDLVRGVLKIFSSRTAPLGAKGWKPLVCYEKSTKSWSWTGPLPQGSTEYETFEEMTSPDTWGIPHKMLVKLVDSFANWLKSGQETLRQIGSLPPPPLELMQVNVDEKERFRDLRAQKSLSTISQSPEEVRAYFRKEEQLRYSVPDRAFSYTAADGKKSIVAPLRRCGGKPTSKARDHFLLKRDRPPHVTILCLVRDAASRLPGSIGTRADVCTLIRDSQYVVEDVTDTQVNSVVSGALDRLHYERDPCVQFDGERKLWVYLHRDREEEDFEDDGTSSTKKWKRQKKDASEQDDQVTVACHGTGEASGFDMGSDLNVEPSCANDDKVLDVVCDDTRQRTEDDVKASDMPDEGAFQQMLGSKLQCQENSANEDFGDDT